MALRSRLMKINPARTVLIRGAVRPGIVVEEAEAPFSQRPTDVYILRWSSPGIDLRLETPMSAAECEISYQTAGTLAFGGLDRGRLLSAMDVELLKILTPFHSPKLDYSVTPAMGLPTQVFWEEAVFGLVDTQRERIGRFARVKVYSYAEEVK